LSRSSAGGEGGEQEEGRERISVELSSHEKGRKKKWGAPSYRQFSEKMAGKYATGDGMEKV